MRWCEIALEQRVQSRRRRFEKLNEEFRACGVASSSEILSATEQTLESVLEQAKQTYEAIRFSPEVGSLVLKTLTQIPAGVATLKTADALVKENGTWWPRCFLVDGLMQTFSSSVTSVDFTGSVFLLGAGGKTRAVAAALSRIGFGRIIIADPDDERSAALVEDLKRSYFGVQFQQTTRGLVTQLPGICSIAVNTLESGEDAANAAELAYFNFLKTGGLWLDLALFPLSLTLQTEAVSVGGELLNGFEVLARTDALWFESAYSTKGETPPPFDIARYMQSLA